VSDAAQDAPGELRDILAVIHLSLFVVERQSHQKEIVARHLSRIREHLERYQAVLEAAGSGS
jgi:hypothetical protein